MIKKVKKIRKARKPTVRKASRRERNRIASQIPAAGTYVTEKHWELW